MQALFSSCSDLISISFNEAFDTSKVQSMSELFHDCHSLTSVNVSSFNTSSVMSFFQMFCLNDKLTSLDLSNFEAKYSCEFHDMFMSLKNLNFIDLSSFYSIYSSGCFLNLYNVKPNGTIIANNKLLIYSDNWAIINK